MARPKKEETNGGIVDSVKIAAESFYKANKSEIYGEYHDPYKVSFGVFSLDVLTGGGISGGTLLRLIGSPSSGKSSEGLLIIKNFLESRPKSRALIIPTEARLTEKMKGRSGVKFVDKPEDWANNTCLILSMNVYEKIANFIWTLVKTNEMRPKEEQENLAIMIDSMDYLTLESDYQKEIGDTLKVAGPQFLSKKLFAKLSLPFNAGGHIFIANSQISSAPKIDPYSKDPIRQGGSSGGHAIQHQATTVIEFAPRYEGDYLLEDADAKYDEKKNPKIGHKVKGWIRKGDNEKYDVKFEYAVKYGRTGGNSVFVESELVDMLITWELLKKESAQGSAIVNPDLLTEMRKIDAEFPDKFRSIGRAVEYLESKPEATKYLVDKFKKMLSK